MRAKILSLPSLRLLLSPEDSYNWRLHHIIPDRPVDYCIMLVWRIGNFPEHKLACWATNRSTRATFDFFCFFSASQWNGQTLASSSLCWIIGFSMASAASHQIINQRPIKSVEREGKQTENIFAPTTAKMTQTGFFYRHRKLPRFTRFKKQLFTSNNMWIDSFTSGSVTVVIYRYRRESHCATARL